MILSFGCNDFQEWIGSPDQLEHTICKRIRMKLYILKARLRKTCKECGLHPSKGRCLKKKHALRLLSIISASYYDYKVI